MPCGIHKAGELESAIAPSQCGSFSALGSFRSRLGFTEQFALYRRRKLFSWPAEISVNATALLRAYALRAGDARPAPQHFVTTRRIIEKWTEKLLKRCGD